MIFKSNFKICHLPSNPNNHRNFSDLMPSFQKHEIKHLSSNNEITKNKNMTKKKTPCASYLNKNFGSHEVLSLQSMGFSEKSLVS